MDWPGLHTDLTDPDLPGRDHPDGRGDMEQRHELVERPDLHPGDATAGADMPCRIYADRGPCVGRHLLVCSNLLAAGRTGCSHLRERLHADNGTHLEWFVMGRSGLHAHSAAARADVLGGLHADDSTDLEWIGLGGTGLHADRPATGSHLPERVHADCGPSMEWHIVVLADMRAQYASVQPEHEHLHDQDHWCVLTIDW